VLAVRDHGGQRHRVHEQCVGSLGVCERVHLDFIGWKGRWRTGYIESFNGRLRDECLSVEVIFSLADARRKLYP
jgi:hypothetical protein